MNTVYRKFYKGFYLRTGGYIPMKPLNQNIYPGDFFQIRNGEIIILGNIYKKKMIIPENTHFDYGITLNSANWNFSEGVSKQYSGRGVGNNAIEGDFTYSTQILSFNGEGSYFFKGSNPESAKISNWNEIKDALIIKLTQTLYSFRELYLVTECVKNDSWTLAIAGSKKGELELATELESSGLADLFGHGSSRTVQSRNIEVYHREEHGKPVFFKAKKLQSQNEQLDTFISELLSEYASRDQWANSFFDFDIPSDSVSFAPTASQASQIELLDLLQTNQLNPNTALMYFKWVDANMDDVEELFKTYQWD